VKRKPSVIASAPVAPTAKLTESDQHQLAQAAKVRVWLYPGDVRIPFFRLMRDFGLVLFTDPRGQKPERVTLTERGKEQLPGART
jgi:hypothetical protein